MRDGLVFLIVIPSGPLMEFVFFIHASLDITSLEVLVSIEENIYTGDE